ncbi:MAG TPA: ParB/RepB/Spo0J family partition protein, partial [Solirubrobacteraceae bacterium]|nr:ParB/RepB/Spo0J family partition protein [Solirubrobacteraceae bacterium]
MTDPTPTHAPTAPLLFDVTEFHSRSVDSGVIERVPLAEIELAPNPRKEMSPEGVARLAKMMMARSQLVPCIGRRDGQRVVLYDGQRRLAAARASHQLADTDGHQGLRALQSLIVLLLDHEPTVDEIRVLQAQANAREELTRGDQQEQFRDCWEAHIGLAEDDRLAAVCFDLGISAKQAANLRRELTLPQAIRARVSDRPAGPQLAVGMATRLADMHQVAPQLTEAVAGRITSRDLHDAALRDMAGFVHRTVVEDESVYAVRIDDGTLLDGHQTVESARQHLTTDDQHHQAARLLGCRTDRLEAELDTLSARAKRKALKLRVDAVLRDRATNGHYAYTVKRGE